MDLKGTSKGPQRYLKWEKMEVNGPKMGKNGLQWTSKKKMDFIEPKIEKMDLKWTSNGSQMDLKKTSNSSQIFQNLMKENLGSSPV